MPPVAKQRKCYRSKVEREEEEANLEELEGTQQWKLPWHLVEIWKSVWSLMVVASDFLKKKIVSKRDREKERGGSVHVILSRLGI